jgi:hypothetical protein
MAVQRVKNSKGEWVVVSGGGGGSGAVDSAMSDTSTNAVQNRVIKNYVDSYYPKDFDLSEFESEDFF